MFKTIEEFTEKLAKVEYLTNFEVFGHYPFQFFAQKEDNKNVMGAMLLGGNVAAVYKTVIEQLKAKAIKVYFTTDFPAVLDIKNDFIAVWACENQKVTVFAIPYCCKTGKTFETIYKAEALEALKNDFYKALKISAITFFTTKN